VIARARGATVHRFRSGDVRHAERLLRGPAAAPRVLCMDGVNSMTGNPPDLPAFAALAREHDALRYVDDAHGFGVIGEHTGYDPSRYGRKGNAVVRWFGESSDHVVLAAGFSKAYSSLLAFLAFPTTLKRYLKVMVPSYLYGGPVPVASLATALLGPAGQPAPRGRPTSPAPPPDQAAARPPGQARGGHQQCLRLPPGRAGPG
jgi:8-amino-7-oxononanoate synthase